MSLPLCMCHYSSDKSVADSFLIYSLNIPASNCAILQRGDDLELLGAGQSVITNPSVTLRGLYTLGENQLEMPTKDMYVCERILYASPLF
jgi:hypothetical protein